MKGGGAIQTLQTLTQRLQWGRAGGRGRGRGRGRGCGIHADSESSDSESQLLVSSRGVKRGRAALESGAPAGNRRKKTGSSTYMCGVAQGRNQGSRGHCPSA